MTAVGAPWCALVPTVMALRRIQAGEFAIMLDYMYVRNHYQWYMMKKRS